MPDHLRHSGPSSGTSDRRRVPNRLLAMSSAAVLAVYTAGYLRTQSAADQFAAEAAERRPVIPAPALPGPDHHHRADPADEGHADQQSGRVSALDADAGGDTHTPATGPASVVANVDTSARPAPTGPGERLPVAAGAPAVGAPAPALPVSPAPPAPSASPAAGSAEEETLKTAAAAARPPVERPAAAPPTSAPAATSVATAVTAAAEPAAPPVPAPPRYKDGTYTGWGTSRHGDIQARVVIENGRITSATIAQCLTRWPCSWIEALPPQVVQRQSPETDYVSGATQSTNAFYYGVVQALGKAALP